MQKQTSQQGPKSKTSTEEFETNQAAKNTVKRTDSALRCLSSWYLEREKLAECSLTNVHSSMQTSTNVCKDGSQHFQLFSA